MEKVVLKDVIDQVTCPVCYQSDGDLDQLLPQIIDKSTLIL